MPICFTNFCCIIIFLKLGFFNFIPGYASTTVPMYVAETAPAAIRGKLITVYQLFITFGQFVASVVDGLFASDHEHGWR